MRIEGGGSSHLSTPAAKRSSVVVRKGARKSRKTANLLICCRIGSSFTTMLCGMHFELRYMLTKVQGSYLKEGFKRNNRYILTFCIGLSSERDIIVPLMGEREQTRNFSLCLRHQSACRHWVLCNFYFLQPWLIACLSACIFFFFYHTVSSLSVHIVHSWMTLPFFLMHNEKAVLYVRVYFFLFAGVAGYKPSAFVAVYY